MAHLRESSDKALKLLRTLPRVQIGNLRPNPNSKQNVSGPFVGRLNNNMLWTFIETATEWIPG